MISNAAVRLICRRQDGGGEPHVDDDKYFPPGTWDNAKVFGLGKFFRKGIGQGHSPT